jgi:hypothetical protein
MIGESRCPKCGLTVEHEYEPGLGQNILEDHECISVLDQVAKLRLDLAFVAGQLAAQMSGRILPVAQRPQPEVERLLEIAGVER